MHEALITPILNQLDFTKNQKNWGYQFRFGLIAISEHDMQLIAQAMQATINIKKERFTCHLYHQP